MSLTRLDAHSGISRSTVHVATKLLKLKPYKIRNVHNLLPPDSVARIEFCRWFQQSVYDGSLDPGLTFFSDEAWFTLNGRVNSQNNRYWGQEIPHEFHEIPLHDEIIEVWCAVSASRIIGQMFFEEK
ncbi:hypothetical protein C0J52_27713 [Blattella germanica]|nr:hypothetical protein C0J52_27713 [Blattella germanica]